MALRLLSTILWTLSAGFIGSLALFYGTTGDASRLPIVGGMITAPGSVERIAPFCILVLLSWVILELGLRAWRVRRQHLANSMFRTFAEEVDLDEYRPYPSKKEVLRAMRRANLFSECHRRDPGSAHEIVPAAAGLDANHLSNSYVPLNVYAWVLPVLGFIGTAGGLASAIAGFKEALNNTTETKALVASLSQLVIPGLAGAFEITMLALAASVVTYIGTSALRSWDQEALDELDRLSVLLLSKIPSPRSEEAKEVLRVLNELSGKLVATLQTPDSLVAAAEAMAAAAQDIGAASEQSSRTLQTAASALAAASEQLTDAALLPYQVSISRGSR